MRTSSRRGCGRDTTIEAGHGRRRPDADLLDVARGAHERCTGRVDEYRGQNDEHPDTGPVCLPAPAGAKIAPLPPGGCTPAAARRTYPESGEIAFGGGAVETAASTAGQ